MVSLNQLPRLDERIRLAKRLPPLHPNLRISSLQMALVLALDKVKKLLFDNILLPEGLGLPSFGASVLVLEAGVALAFGGLLPLEGSPFAFVEIWEKFLEKGIELSFFALVGAFFVGGGGGADVQPLDGKPDLGIDVFDRSLRDDLE